MSSSARNNATIDSHSHYRAGIQHIQEKNFKEALTCLQRALEKDPANAEIYLAKSQAEYHLQNLDQSLKDINKGLEVIENCDQDDESGLILKVRLLNMRARTYKELHNYSKAQADQDQVKAILQQNAQNDKLSSLLSPGLVGDHVRKSSINTNHGSLEDEDQKKEAQKLYELIQEATDKKLLTTEFSIVHLISMKWFEKWRRYTGFQFESLYKSQSTSSDKSANDSNEGLLKEEHEKIHPGPINSDDILDKEAEILADPDQVKEYCNYAVKQGLTENRDFIILSNPVWKYLYSIYAGKDIKRYVVSINDDTNQTSIEIWLKRINILVCPPIEKNQEYFQCEVQTLFMSKKETVKDLREKIARIYKVKGKIESKVTISACRLWKLDPREDNRQVIKNAEESNELVPLRGKKLTDGTVLEDAELGDTDVVICEYKVGNSWKFITEEEHRQIVLTKCAYCGAKKDNLAFCECKTLKYCDAICQKSHRSKHKEKCNKIKNSLNRNNEIMRQFKLSKTKFSTGSRYGMCGLQNLGNTCFMNSSLQCLSHVSELTYYFLENRFIKDLNRHNRLGTGGRLAAAYAELMKELWHGTDSYVSPWDIKKIIAEVASQFSGYNQQDAQEFLSYLVDGLHEDLNKIVNKPYVETIESDDRPDEIVAKQSWDNHIKRNQSIIVDLLHGQFKSKLICPDCKKISITFDPFMTLSLPIPHSNLITLPLYFIHKNNKNLPYKIILTLDPAAPASEIIEKVSELLSVPQGAMELNLLKDQLISRTRLNRYDIKALKDDDATPFVYQIHDPEIDGPLKKFLEQDKIKTEIQMFKNGEEIEHISFSRLIHISKKSTLKELHMQVYFVLRGYLAHVFPQEDSADFSIDADKWDMDTLEEEYKRFRALDQNIPYQIAFADESKKFYAFQFDETRKLDEVIRLGDILSLSLFFNADFNTDAMKINKCHDYEGSNNSPLKDRKSYSLSDCFDLFTTPEVLDQDNLWYCNKCKDHKQATKKMDIYKLPKVLVLHLKRFKTSRVHSIGSFFFSGGSSKITTLIDFPIENLDLSKYALGKWDEPPIYDLFAITNHYGSLGGGHYTAYAKNPLKNVWYDFNDSSVSKQDRNELVSGAAYLLFYKRREVEKPPGSSNS